MKFRFILALLAAVPSLFAADEVQEQDGLTLDLEAIDSFLSANCYECHDDLVKEGGLDLFDLSGDLSDPDVLTHWQHVYDRVKSGEMPPKEKERPDSIEKLTFLASVYPQLRAADVYQDEANGRSLARRLTHKEFENSVKEIFKINIPLQGYLIPNATATVFQNDSYEQQVSHYDVEAYLAAVDAALANAEQLAFQDPSAQLSKRLVAKDIIHRNTGRREPQALGDGSAVVWSANGPFIGRIPKTSFSKTSVYRYRIQVDGINFPKDGRPIWVSVTAGRQQADAPIQRMVSFFPLYENEGRKWIEFETFLEAGERLAIRPEDRTLQRVSLAAVVNNWAKDKGVPGVRIHRIDIDEQLDQGISQAAREALYGRYLIPAPKGHKQRFVWKKGDRRAVVHDLVSRFATTAFRRPVDNEVLAPYLGIVFSRLDQDYSLMDALRYAYRAILVSPRFMFLQEEPGALDPYAIASRMSYFLWSSPPDDKLLLAAADGSLTDPEIRFEHLSRMMKDPRFQDFVTVFTDEWLDLDEIDFTSPDVNDYPKFDEILKHSMLEETRSYFRYQLKKNLSASTIARSDFTMMNERLAHHYQLTKLGKRSTQKVKLPADSVRGGFLTQASVLKVTADGSHTSPILRGIWILERILGKHVSSPPDEVPAVEPDIRGAKTIREQLAMHRDVKGCASCHYKIDPPGFALENFDPVGAWRTHYWATHRVAKQINKKAKPLIVEAHYQTEDGIPFAGIRDYKDIVAADEEGLARNYAKKLTAYATGAPVRFKDREAIEKILELSSTDGTYRMRSILENLVRSDLFASK